MKSFKINCFHRYGRDYYINDAKAPTGTRRRQSDVMISSSDDDYVSDFDTLVKFRRRTRPNSILYSNAVTTARRTQSLRSLHQQQHQQHRKFQTRIRSVSHSDDYLSKHKNEKLFDIEREILHSDLRRNSFRSRNGLKNFVLNPIFDNDELEDDGQNRIGSQNNKSLGNLPEDVLTPLHNRGNSLRMKRMSSLW